MKLLASTYGDICFGKTEDGLQKAIDDLSPSSLVIVADAHTAKFCLPLLENILQSPHIIVIPPGDQHKSLESCQQIWTTMLNADADRSTLVLNVGGGMICDLGGYAASCYKRGVRFGHIPTSLLAMTDAAIGGKTGINFSGYKNLIGRFEVPSLTWIDPQFLNTLPAQEISDGMAEVVKHAIINSKDLWDLLSQADNLSDIEWSPIIYHSILAKQRIVGMDPFEKGIRKTLNFGHTLGHALESHALQGDYPMSHGQAITLGMMAELRIAEQMGHLKNEDFHRIISLIVRLLRPSEVTLPTMDVLLHWLQGDKKKFGGVIGYSLPDRIGSCAWDIAVEEPYITESLKWLSVHLKASL